MEQLLPHAPVPRGCRPAPVMCEFLAAHQTCADGMGWLWLDWTPPAPEPRPQDDHLVKHMVSATLAAGAKLSRYGRRWLTLAHE